MNTQILYDRILTTVEIDDHLMIDMTHTDNDDVLDHVVLFDAYYPLYGAELNF